MDRFWVSCDDRVLVPLLDRVVNVDLYGVALLLRGYFPWEK